MRLPDTHYTLLSEAFGVFFRSGFRRVNLKKTSPKTQAFLKRPFFVGPILLGNVRALGADGWKPY